MKSGADKPQTSRPKDPEGPSLSLSALFLAWGPPSHTRRSELMARKLGIPLRRVHMLEKKRHLAPLRYALQAIPTLIILFRERPRAVFVQNPPIFAPLFAWIYCALRHNSLFIDSHTTALLGKSWKWSVGLHRFLARRAKASLVTGDHLARLIQDWGAKTQIVMDVPSELPTDKPYPLEHPFNIAVVCSFSPDEPLAEVTQAAASLPDVGFYVTGNPESGVNRLPEYLPPNLHPTGFLADDAYYGLLGSVDAVMALTTRDHTMQRGACEAVWLGQPIITSHWPVLRQGFHKGTIHVDNTVVGIKTGVLEMLAKRQELASEVKLLQEERQREWQEIVIQLDALMQIDN